MNYLLLDRAIQYAEIGSTIALIKDDGEILTVKQLPHKLSKSVPLIEKQGFVVRDRFLRDLDNNVVGTYQFDGIDDC